MKTMRRQNSTWRRIFVQKKTTDWGQSKIDPQAGVTVSLGLRSQVRISLHLLNHPNTTPMPSVPSLEASYCKL